MAFISRIPLYGDEYVFTPKKDMLLFNRDSIDHPREGDWRFIHIPGERNSRFERYELGEWVYHGDLGKGFHTKDLSMKDKTNIFYYTDEDGNKIVYLRASLIDGGTYLGCIGKGISFVHNGRLESWRASSSTLTTPIYNEGSDVSDGTFFQIDTPILSVYQSPMSISFYLDTVPTGTKVMMHIDEGESEWYRNVSDFNFSLGFGDDVHTGENVLVFNPCLNIPSGSSYTVSLTFSNTVGMIGLDTPPFGFKNKFTYKILTPSSMPQIAAKCGPSTVVISNYAPTYKSFCSFPNVICEANSLHRVSLYYNAVFTSPALRGTIRFYVNGVLVGSSEILPDTSSLSFCCSTSVMTQGIHLEAAITTGPAGNSITLNNLYFIFEEI